MMKDLKGITIEKQHLRRVAPSRQLTTAVFVGGLLTLLFGTWIAPWAWASLLWLFHHLPWWYEDGSFPVLLSFLAKPNLFIGLIWLLYYVITYGYATFTESPRQKQQAAWQAEQEYRERSRRQQDFSPRMDSYYYQQAKPKPPEPAPLSQAWPGELKHQLVEQCYEHFRKALKRFDPSPIDLKTPKTFYYQKGGHIRWTYPADPQLVLPEEALTPSHIHEILPMLAHALAEYNSEELTLPDMSNYPDYVPAAFLLFITGNFLWLPVVSRHKIEKRIETEARQNRKLRVLEADEFAVMLGQGPALEHLLRLAEEELKQQGERDTNKPTLVERIGRLEVLNNREREAMRKLGLTPKESPLVFDPPRPRLGEGKRS